MADVDEALARAGLVPLGEEGTQEEVLATWHPFWLGSAVPTVRVPDDDQAMAEVARSFTALADELGLMDAGGEFLIAVATGSGRLGPWIRVRASGPLQVESLGEHPGSPEFLATSIDRSVAIAVDTEEGDFWILDNRGAGPGGATTEQARDA